MRPTKSFSLTDAHGGNPQETARRLGLGKAPPVRLDFSVNLNPLGPPTAVEEIMLAADFDWTGYPPTDPAAAEAALAGNMGLAPNRLILCNGATEALHLIVRALKVRTAAWLAPSYSGYWEVCAKANVQAFPVTEFATLKVSPSNERQLSPPDKKPDLVFICNPNNPNGFLFDKKTLLDAIASHPATFFVVDESFMDFVDKRNPPSLLRVQLDNLVILKSLTKVFSIAGVRIGAAISTPRTITAMKALRLPWSLNAIAQRFAGVLYADAAHLKRTRAAVAAGRKELTRALSRLPAVTPHPSETNFILAEFDADATPVQQALLAQGILLRSCAEIPGLDNRFVRIAVRSSEENTQLVAALKEILGTGGTKRPPRPTRRAKAIMVVGTMSNSGKTWLAAALCRHFARKGVSVAPFKAQNMALNSFVTPDGGEIGRAQALQARAAGVAPHIDMNPVLLKPTGDARSQVVVNGKPWGDTDARGYYAKKNLFKRKAFEAFDRLAATCDLVVLEGAGSPTEINLLDKDFVNMAMARHAGAKTILVADIDRGGVFASIFGTVRLLPPELRAFLSGIVINKFRGDPSLLDKGIATIERLTNLPVLGVIPYNKNIILEEEDSLGLEGKNAAGPRLLDIVVPRLPRISNYTDFLALETAPGVGVRYEERASKNGSPDLLIIPDTKNTLADLEVLKQSGWAAGISRALKRKISVSVGATKCSGGKSPIRTTWSLTSAKLTGSASSRWTPSSPKKNISRKPAARPSRRCRSPRREATSPAMRSTWE